MTLKKTKVAYLFGAGATHGEIDNIAELLIGASVRPEEIALF
ncbi:MAG: hypothetical protein AAB804_00180 [Patescibacteria group bacterium]